MSEKETPITPINIWRDITRTYVMRLDLVCEGNAIVGIHDPDMDNAIAEIDWICEKLQTYKSELELYYGVEKTFTHRSKLATYVYLMYCNRTRFHKIGRSINPSNREKTLQSEQPNISMVFISPLTEIETEKMFHKKFSNKRVRGEWFELNAEDVDFIKSYEY